VRAAPPTRPARDAQRTSPSQYRQLADLLRAAILRRDYPPGSTFPSEPELAERHGVSRPTINRALLVLRSEGLIRVERGRGTIVRSVPTIPRYATTRYARENREHDDARGAFDTEISRLGFEPRSDLVQVGRTRPPADVAPALALAPGDDVLIRKRHMYAADTPVQLATSYVPGRSPTEPSSNRPTQVPAAPTRDSPTSATRQPDSPRQSRCAPHPLKKQTSSGSPTNSTSS
jgi:DNA-binding GntR family transcriptional regulator